MSLFLPTSYKICKIVTFLCSPRRFLRISNRRYAKKDNYFDVFKFPTSYDVPVEHLTDKYRDLLKRFHPDKFHQRPQEEKDESEVRSRLANQAYRVLKNPLERGLHLLDLKGSPQEESKLDVSSQALMAIYEINDELSETKDVTRIQQLKQENDQRISVLEKKISQAFQNDQIEDAKKLLAQIKYFVTIEERIRTLELELGVVRE